MFVHLGSFANLGGVEWVRQGLHRLAPDDARLLTRRWGLDGSPPRSIAELAREEGITPIAMVRRLQAAELGLLRAMGMARPAAGQGNRPGRGPGSARPPLPPARPRHRPSP